MRTDFCHYPNIPGCILGSADFKIHLIGFLPEVCIRKIGANVLFITYKPVFTTKKMQISRNFFLKLAPSQDLPMQKHKYNMGFCDYKTLNQFNTEIPDVGLAKYLQR